MTQQAVIKLQIPSVLGSEKEPMDQAASLAQEMGFSTDRVDGLRMAVCEACLNAIEHGNQQDDADPVEVTLTRQASALQIDVDDHGPGIKSMPKAKPSLHQKLAGKEPSRGWGLFLIQNMVDEVQIEQTPKGGNRIRLIMRTQS